MVGLGKVKGSQKTTPLEVRLASLVSLLASGQPSAPAMLILSPLMIELCDTPVECDLEINEAASGVAVCNTGLLITGLEGTIGKVEDLDMPKPFLGPEAAELDVGDGKVLVLDSKGIVVADVIEYAVVTGDDALVLVVFVVVVAAVFVGLGVLTLVLLPP